MPVRVSTPLKIWSSRRSSTLKRLKTKDCSSSLIPLPVFFIIKCRYPSIKVIFNDTVPLSGVYLKALDSKLNKTFSNALRSVFQVLTSGVISIVKVISFSSAISTKLPVVLATSSHISTSCTYNSKYPVSTLRNSINCCISDCIRSAFDFITDKYRFNTGLSPHNLNNLSEGP